MPSIDTSVLSPIMTKLFRRGRGILAADESTTTAKKRLDIVGLPNTFENRRIFRDILIATPGNEEYMSGIILYPETLFQDSLEGTPFTTLLKEKNIAIGVKVDLGAYNMPGFEGDFLTSGLDGLRDRLKEYKEAGAEFTKFRCVFSIAEGLPSMESIHTNCLTLALSSRIIQEEGMVPIVEPEVLYDGDHTIEDSQRVTGQIVDHLYYEMRRMNVDISHVVLKTSMVLAGNAHSVQSTPEEVADATVAMLTEYVPSDARGVVFLSGGQTPEQSLANFDAIADREPLPFEVAFSFARALQDGPLRAWKGREDLLPQARTAFLDVLQKACDADKGRYILR